MFRNLILVGIGIILIGPMLCISQIIKMVTYHEPFRLVYIFLPFIDPFTKRGYWINFWFHWVLVHPAYTLSIIPITAWLLVLNSFMTPVLMIKQDLDDLTSERPPKDVAKREMLKVLYKIQSVDRYVLLTSRISLQKGRQNIVEKLWLNWNFFNSIRYMQDAAEYIYWVTLLGPPCYKFTLVCTITVTLFVMAFSFCV